MANSALSLLFSNRRSFLYIDSYTFRMIFNQFVRSEVRRSIQSWRPFFEQDMLLLEGMQRRATKMVVDLSHLTYERWHSTPNVFPVAYRTDREGLIFICKVLHSFAKPYPSTSFPLSHTTWLRAYSHKLPKIWFCTTIGVVFKVTALCRSGTLFHLI